MDSAVSVPAEKLSHKEVFAHETKCTNGSVPAGGGAGPTMAGLEAGVGPRLCLRPGAPEAMENVPQITEKGLTLGNNSVKYPEITGMADESIQQQVNDAILQAGKIENRLSRMAVLMSSPVPLTVTY